MTILVEDGIWHFNSSPRIDSRNDYPNQLPHISNFYVGHGTTMVLGRPWLRIVRIKKNWPKNVLTFQRVRKKARMHTIGRAIAR